ncbi:MAG: type II toxin-antitoxin system Phd/YefM family antitoxin [Acidimicrobiales bacterium]
MTTSTPLPLSEVKAHLSELVSRVGGQHERVTVTVHGRPTAVLVAVDDLAALEETIAILSDPQGMAAIAASEDEIARGDLFSEDELAEAMAARRRAPR